MQPFRASLTVALLVALSLTSYGPAAAGGPTSALLSVPGEGTTASLYYTDPEYDALAHLVGIDTASGMGEVDRSGRDHATGPGVTVTWLIHDVTPWRVDHIYPQTKGAPWIATQVASESGSIWDSPAVWHRPTSGAELVALLDTLGVGDAAREADGFSGVAGAPVPPPAAPPVDQATPAEPSGTAGIWWALGGLVAGVLATLLVTRLRRTRAPGPAAEPAPADGATTGVAEELSWPAAR